MQNKFKEAGEASAEAHALHSRPIYPLDIPTHYRNKNVYSYNRPRFSSYRPNSSSWSSRRYFNMSDVQPRTSRRTEEPNNPFELANGLLELGIQDENFGVNFDAYEDVPVEIRGLDVPPSVNNFREIDMGDALNLNIKRCKFLKPTPVQCYAIPIILAGRDLMACAQTGSGKTAAFCFPIICGIMRAGVMQNDPSLGPHRACPLALILSPTRELSHQIYTEAKKFSYQTPVRIVVAYGGTPIHHQIHELEKGADIVVATPGRLADLMDRGRISFQCIKYLALDEADRMLDMGFEPQIRKIVDGMDMPQTGQRQTVLFSATFPNEIQRLASDFLSNHVFLAVGRVGSSTNLISQKVEFVEENDKRDYLLRFLRAQRSTAYLAKELLTLIFVEKKKVADMLEYWLQRHGFPVTAIHGDKSQMERDKALRSFKTGAVSIMVATDIASRGLDIPNVSHVINFDLPKDIDSYVHRIGRTGRAGKVGLATAFFTEENRPMAKALVNLMQEANQEVPEWLLQYAERPSHGGGRSRMYSGGRFGGHGSFHYSQLRKGGFQRFD